MLRLEVQVTLGSKGKDWSRHKGAQLQMFQFVYLEDDLHASCPCRWVVPKCPCCVFSLVKFHDMSHSNWLGALDMGLYVEIGRH